MWLLSQTWITIHIWTPNCERLEKTEKLFMRPMYDAFLIDQSIALNRRRDEEFHKLDPGDIPLGGFFLISRKLFIVCYLILNCEY